uniref:Uncharacterized protein n=1 Tax=Anguilla anguilla TaxID=7936 RepID=A0A0E9WT43_ANGAN
MSTAHIQGHTENTELEYLESFFFFLVCGGEGAGWEVGVKISCTG